MQILADLPTRTPAAPATPATAAATSTTTAAPTTPATRATPAAPTSTTPAAPTAGYSTPATTAPPEPSSTTASYSSSTSPLSAQPTTTSSPFPHPSTPFPQLIKVAPVSRQHTPEVRPAPEVRPTLPLSPHTWRASSKATTAGYDVVDGDTSKDEADTEMMLAFPFNPMASSSAPRAPPMPTPRPSIRYDYWVL